MTNNSADDLSPRFSYLIGRLDRMVRRELSDALADANLTLNQYTTLSILVARPGLTNAQLARRALVSPQAMNQAINALIKQGFVERQPHPTNRRKLRVTLTPAGKVMLGKVEAIIDQAEDKILQRLGDSERVDLQRNLRILAQLESPHDGQR